MLMERLKAFMRNDWQVKHIAVYLVDFVQFLRGEILSAELFQNIHPHFLRVGDDKKKLSSADIGPATESWISELYNALFSF